MQLERRITALATALALTFGCASITTNRFLRMGDAHDLARRLAVTTWNEGIERTVHYSSWPYSSWPAIARKMEITSGESRYTIDVHQVRELIWREVYVFIKEESPLVSAKYKHNFNGSGNKADFLWGRVLVKGQEDPLTCSGDALKLDERRDCARVITRYKHTLRHLAEIVEQTAAQ